MENKVAKHSPLGRAENWRVRVKRVKAPRRLMHCTDPNCRGVLEAICFWTQFGARRFKLMRRVFMRQCVKCKNRFMDEICMLKNEHEIFKQDKKLTRYRIEEGELDGSRLWRPNEH